MIPRFKFLYYIYHAEVILNRSKPPHMAYDKSVLKVVFPTDGITQFRIELELIKIYSIANQ